MNRTFVLKLTYCTVIILATASAFWLTAKHNSLLLILAIIGIFLIPGRIQGYFFRDLFMARRLLDLEKPQDSIFHGIQFLHKLQKKPWLNKLLWLSGTIYTINVEAMCLNNLGAAELLLGNLFDAEKNFSSALLLDPKYPLPHFNLAVIYKLQDDELKSEEHLYSSFKLGYTGATSDAVIQKAQSLFAQIEGKITKL